MLKYITFPGVLVLLLIQACIGEVLADPQNLATDNSQRANQILRQIDDMWRGDSSYAVIHMRVKTAHYERNMTMHGWSKGTEKSLVRIVAPLKEKDTATLKSGNRIFTYLPKTDRTIRLTSGMMMGSWMGSHFTNDDLVKESRREEDFDALISFEGERDSRKIIEFSLIPK
ncbi:MAG: outer membrane lipoprotein-sorting protein, partial [Gammaproteobacteria bacterium]|nr:outer membrane lipoprotein-sorting protein [Gammaproteobacteria bacterium]